MKIIIILLLFFSINIYSQSWIEDWQKAIVSIGVTDSIPYKAQNQIYHKKYFSLIGTGVLFYIKIDTLPIPVLITAKHVFSSPEEKWEPELVNIRFSSDESKSVYEYFGITVKLKDQNKINWISHPNNKVDLACLPLKFSDIPDKANVKVLPYSMIAANEDLYQGAKVFVLGYPTATGLEFWTKALLREGIIAWTPPEGSDEDRILIDCDVFPGNSGGPVFKVPIGVDKYGTVLSGGEIKFIGIVTQRRFSQTKIISKNREAYDQNELQSFESIGIGVIEPSVRVVELLNMINEAVRQKLKH